MNLPCCINSPCFDPANPIANFSAELPDAEIFIGYNTGWGGNVPPIGDSWGTLGCTSFCQSTVSQADADLCAANQQLACTVVDHGKDKPGWKDPPGKPVPLFSNRAQHCDIVCPDGLPFRFTIQAGQYTGLNQAQADAIAQNVACIIGQSERMCLSSIQNLTCVGSFYISSISTDGGASPISYSLISGSLPPGLSFNPAGGLVSVISGIPTTPGAYSFTIRAVDRFGLFMVKSYSIGVIGVTNSPPVASENQDYSFQYTVSGGVAPYTFAVDDGELPDGITLSPSGLLSGKATVNGDFNFTLSFTDSTP